MLKILLFPMMFTCGYGAELFVSPTGKDTNPGTKELPFVSIAAAVKQLKPGDTCVLRKGRYAVPIQLSGLQGTEQRPITFKAHADEVVTLDGCDPLNVQWKPWKNGIYKARLKNDIWQLFSGQKAIDLARWPNASLEDESVWKASASMRSTDRKWSRKAQFGGCQTQRGKIVDKTPSNAPEGKNRQTLAETGIDFTGAIAVLNVGHWLTWTRPIESHKDGSDTFTYSSKGTHMAKFLKYYIYGLQALDRPGEWWYDSSSNDLYYKPKKGEKPQQMAFRGKRRDFMLKVSGCHHLQFKNLHFFGGTFGINNSSNILVDNCHLNYPSTHKFLLGKFNWVSEKQAFPSGNNLTFIMNKGSSRNFNNWVTNSVFAYPNSPAISIRSAGSGLRNCSLHHIAWDVNSSGGSGSVTGGSKVSVIGCTMHTTGASEGIRLGSKSTVAYNRIYNTSLLQHDGSAINVGTNSQPGTMIWRNWVYKTHRQGIRFDSTTTAFGKGASAIDNVVFKIDSGKGINRFKGDYHYVANNTFFDCLMTIPKGYGKTQKHNEHTLTRNNLADYLVEWNSTNRSKGVPGILSNNVRGKGVVRKLLRSPDHFDFRPKATSTQIIDQGAITKPSELPSKDVRMAKQKWVGKSLDIGAYEYGAENYWIPGFQREKSSFSIPVDGVEDYPLNGDLMWQPGRDAVKHDVHVSLSKESLKVLKVDARSTVKQALATASNILPVSGLRTEKTYYWRVDTIRKDGSKVVGDIWQFKMANSGR